MLKDLIVKNRSYRRFEQDKSISKDTLTELVDLARLSPSAANKQAFKYILSNTPEKNAEVFKHLAWAAYFKDWSGPNEGEQPSAYIIMLNDTTINTKFFCDDGIAAQSIMLGAVEKGLGGCIMGGVQRAKLRAVLNIPSQYEVLYVLALGIPKETVVIEKLEDSVKYWRDVDAVHHVPKRSLDDLILDL